MGRVRYETEETSQQGFSSRSRTRARSPFLLNRSTRTVPHTSPSLYTRDLFERSDKAVDGLKNKKRQAMFSRKEKIVE